MKYLLLLTLTIVFSFQVLKAQTTNIIILNTAEKQNLSNCLASNKEANTLFQTIEKNANLVLHKSPNPLKVIYYEGLLNTNPKRIKTTKSLSDIDNVVSLIYCSYSNQNPEYGNKAKKIIVAWAKKYKPTGNPINENKFNAFFWGYYLFKSHFNKKEQKLVENWFLEIAEKEMNRIQTPNNNWEAKRCKIIGIIGCILKNDELITYSVKHFKKYISTAYYADGTSRDLEQRDALHYHIGGLKPCLSAFINLSKFNRAFELYDYLSENGSSVKKSVEYVVPFATGEKQRKEWINTKVALDKERAAAGLNEYQPGKLFDPEKAYPLFELACYYNRDWISIFEKNNNLNSWIGLLNSPLIRK